MNKLYDKSIDRMNQVFCLTADDATDAHNKALTLVEEDFREDYQESRVHFMCNTPDVVDGFEPI